MKKHSEAIEVEYAGLRAVLASGRKLSMRQQELIGESIRRFEERGNDSKQKKRQRLESLPGGPARRSGGRNYGTIGARYAGLSMRVDHYLGVQNKAKYGTTR